VIQSAIQARQPITLGKRPCAGWVQILKKPAASEEIVGAAAPSPWGMRRNTDFESLNLTRSSAEKNQDTVYPKKAKDEPRSEFSIRLAFDPFASFA